MLGLPNGSDASSFSRQCHRIKLAGEGSFHLVFLLLGKEAISGVIQCDVFFL